MRSKKLGIALAVSAAVVMAGGCASYQHGHPMKNEKPQVVKQKSTMKAPKHYKGTPSNKK